MMIERILKIYSFKKLGIMARQNGIIKLKGTIGDITFCKTKEGHLAINQLNAVTANRVGPLFLAYGVEFDKEVNSRMYPLKNGAYNPLVLIWVSGL